MYSTYIPLCINVMKCEHVAGVNYTQNCIDEDLRLNNELFGWPAKIEPMFEVSQLKLASKREEAELALKNKLILIVNV